MTNSVILIWGMFSARAGGLDARARRLEGRGVGEIKRVTRMDVPSASTARALTTLRLQWGSCRTLACHLLQSRTTMSGSDWRKKGIQWNKQPVILPHLDACLAMSSASPLILSSSTRLGGETWGRRAMQRCTQGGRSETWRYPRTTGGVSSLNTPSRTCRDYNLYVPSILKSKIELHPSIVTIFGR